MMQRVGHKHQDAQCKVFLALSGTSENSLQLPRRDLPPPPELPAEDDGRVRGQDTADLLQFFKQAQATSSAITTQV